MKKIFNEKLLPWLPMATGIGGLLLRVWLFAIGPDERGLLPESHPANILVYAVAVLTLVLLLLCMPDRERTVEASPAVGGIGIAGQVAAAVGILAASFTESGASFDAISILNAAMAVIAAVCLILLSLRHLTGHRKASYELVFVTVYFMTHLVCQYRHWSAEPQLQNYLFQMLGSIFLMTACFYRTSLSLLGGRVRGFAFFNQAAMFCSILSLNTVMWPFYLAMAVWTTADFYTVMAQRRDDLPQGGELL